MSSPNTSNNPEHPDFPFRFGDDDLSWLDFDEKKSLDKKDFKEWNEDDHPRDEDGKWTDAGGGDSGGGSGEGSSAQSLHQPESTTVEQVISSVPHAAAQIAEVRQNLKQFVPTDAPVAQGGFKRPNGQWTEPRQRLHGDIIKNYFSPAAVAAATPKAGEKPTVYLLGGRAGSGKGWFTGAGKVVDTKTAIVINNDDIKAALPEYKGWSAPLLHEESSEIANKIEDIARDTKLNIVIDGTMRTPEKTQARVAAYKAAGYRVEGYYMYASPVTAVTRALQRFTETGRFVAPEYALTSTTNEATFDNVRDKLDKWAIYDNSGKAPKLYAKSQ